MMQRPKKNETRVNHRIRVREVRVLGPEGDQLGILQTDEAMRRAQDLGLDLVEISPTARPPVCKMMDYGKYKYTTKKKAGEQRKNQRTIEVKEVKFRPKTDVNDVTIKLERARRFLNEGNKVKATIMFRGREITHPEIGQQILVDVALRLDEDAQVEFMPRMEGRTMFMILAPLKPGGKPKPKVQPAAKSRDKGSAKDAPKVAAKDAPKVAAKDAPKDAPKVAAKDASKDAAQEQSDGGAAQ